MRSWTTSATMSLSRCGRCRRVVWTSNHFSALLEACRRRCIHAPLRTHVCKCGALGRAELPTVLLTPLQNGTLETKVARSSDRPVSCILFYWLSLPLLPETLTQSAVPTLIVRYAPQTRVWLFSRCTSTTRRQRWVRSPQCARHAPPSSAGMLGTFRRIAHLR